MTAPPTRRRSRRTPTALGVLLMLTTTFMACGNDDSDDSNTDDADTDAETAADQVTLRLIAFRPDELTVEAGTSVRWVQEDAGAHTVTSGTVVQGTGDVDTEPDGRFDSGELRTDARFQHTFEQPGSYPYFCAIHPATMRGLITVT